MYPGINSAKWFITYDYMRRKKISRAIVDSYCGNNVIWAYALLKRDENVLCVITRVPKGLGSNENYLEYIANNEGNWVHSFSINMECSNTK